MTVCALLLAAGSGSRMGCSKPLLDIQGAPALARVLGTIDRAQISPVIVILGRDADLVCSRVDLRRREIVVNPHPERGLSSSLSLGLTAVPLESLGALVFHADMPFVQPATALAVAAAAGDDPLLVAPRYRGTRGFPVFISRRCFRMLQRQLQGDVGARTFIEQHLAELRLVDVDDPGCVRDFDRPDDLAALAKEDPWTTSA